jgi:hypothetical protein
MNTSTLIDVVAMINARLSKEDLTLKWPYEDDEYIPQYNFILGQRASLEELGKYLQLVIDADVASIEV